MSSRRVITLLVALAVGALAAVGLLFYVQGVEEQASESGQVQSVWVVQESIPRGTPAAQVVANGLIQREDIPIEYFPATAIGEPETELAGLVAVTDLPANTVLVTGHFVSPNVVATGVTDRLEERGMVTVTFSLDQVHGAAYLVEPGDFVNILAKFDVEVGVDPTGEQTSEEYDRSNVMAYSTDARYLYQKAEVLAVDTDLTADLGDATVTDDPNAPPTARNGGLITLAVPPEAVQRIVGIGVENIYLSLVPQNYVPRELAPLELKEELLPGEDPERLTPYIGTDITAPAAESTAPDPAETPTPEPEGDAGTPAEGEAPAGQ